MSTLRVIQYNTNQTKAHCTVCMFLVICGFRREMVSLDIHQELMKISDEKSRDAEFSLVQLKSEVCKSFSIFILLKWNEPTVYVISIRIFFFVFHSHNMDLVWCKTRQCPRQYLQCNSSKTIHV